jgi:hypothetical protein
LPIVKLTARAGIVVDEIVLNVTQYQYNHPAGSRIIQGFAAQDCSWQVNLPGGSYSLAPLTRRRSGGLFTIVNSGSR